ncbi:uncharacterized protein LOC107730906 [Sinocyclocheilus rhinocerous]|uniref:uncharacterized protein LOC107730906 n=1 Tax=Sinocyclocheilus rhinocerous TaxID=307959 RepID=UPI0007B847C3|nr:PREDICTED: uncharacterized protein LOC107730906 [Sinocyclocheilus rhinocerous]
MILPTHFFKKSSFYYNYKTGPGAGVDLTDRPLRVTVGRHKDLCIIQKVLCSVWLTPAPGATQKKQSMSSSPKDVILPSAEHIYSKNSKDPPDFRNYKVVIFNRSFSRTGSYEETDEDFIVKTTDSGIFYKDYSNKIKSLEYLIYKTNDPYQDIKNYKYISLKKEKSAIFNRFFNDLDKETKKTLKLKKQLAFICFIKKDGSFDMNRWKVYKKSDLLEEDHTEDKIFKLLLEIFLEDECCYSEINIFSTNSPCLSRPNRVPCMIQAVVIAMMLYKKHGIKTTIAYLEPWGFSGSYENLLPECSIKDCIYNFESQMLGSKDIINNSLQAPINTIEIDMELISSIYKPFIPELENQTFSMKYTKITETKIPRPKLQLAQFCSEISEPEIKENFIKSLNKIKSDLFKKEDLVKTFGDFKKHGLEMFEKCMNKIYDLLIEINYANIYEEIHEYLKNVFFPWWARKVEDAFNKFLKKQTSCCLQERAVCHFLREIKETGHFLDIANVILENYNI